MIDQASLFQLSRVLARAGIDGTAAYIDDLHRLHAILGSAPQGFPWWTAALLSLLLLGWLAGLAWGWVYLNRRALRQAAPAAGAPVGPTAAAAASAVPSRA
jgi:hypothetical protein